MLGPPSLTAYCQAYSLSYLSLGRPELRHVIPTYLGTYSSIPFTWMDPAMIGSCALEYEQGKLEQGYGWKYLSKASPIYYLRTEGKVGTVLEKRH